MIIENVSATNMRVNLTDYIEKLDASKRFAITKHGKIIAYVVSPVDPSMQAVEATVEATVEAVEAVEAVAEDFDLAGAIASVSFTDEQTDEPILETQAEADADFDAFLNSLVQASSDNRIDEQASV